MTFLQAVQALSEGVCEGIKRPDWKWYMKKEESYLTTTHGLSLAIESYLATDWELVGEVPQFEDVEVVRWQCLTCGYIEGDGRIPSPNSCCRSEERIKLTGTYKRPR